MSSLNHGTFGRLTIVLVLSGANLSSMSARVLLKQSESASFLSQCTLAQSIEEAISAENVAISIFLSLRKVSFLHDKAGREKPTEHWIIKWSEMGKVDLGETRTILSEERVIIKSKVWPDKWVGPKRVAKDRKFPVNPQISWCHCHGGHLN